MAGSGVVSEAVVLFDSFGTDSVAISNEGKPQVHSEKECECERATGVVVAVQAEATMCDPNAQYGPKEHLMVVAVAWEVKVTVVSYQVVQTPSARVRSVSVVTQAQEHQRLCCE